MVNVRTYCGLSLGNEGLLRRKEDSRKIVERWRMGSGNGAYGVCGFRWWC